MTPVREVLAGRYELVDQLGRGGMGVVYAATDRALERRVAVKVLPVDRAADPMLVARFEREALAAAALSHPNIVAVYDTGLDQGTHYIVMEYVPGESLAQLVHRRGMLAPAQAVEITAQIASALAAAHDAGIVHRDIKPANAMVDARGAVKVLDFGIARMASGTTLTHASMVLGSAPYIAPEVAQGRAADARSDIYSLGCVLYELLTGRAPFTGELAAAVLHQHSTAIPQAPAALNPAVPPALEALVMRMLAKAPDDRPQRADELIAGLGRALGTREGTATTVDLAGAAVTAPTRVLAPVAGTAPTRVRAPAAGTAPTRVRAPAPAGSRLGMLLAATASLLALAVVLTILLSSGGGRGHPAADTTRNTPTHTASSTSTTTQSATTTAANTATTTASDTTSTASTPQTGPPSLAAASGALTTLLAQDLQSGTIDPQASQQILGQLQAVLGQYERGQSDGALKQLGNLTKQIAQLAHHGDISPSAATAIDTAVGTFGTALADAAPLDNPGGPGHTQDKHQPGPGHQHGPKSGGHGGG